MFLLEELNRNGPESVPTALVKTEANAVAVVSNDGHFASPSLDKLLDSGFYTGELTELSGGPGSGKSQVGFSEHGIAVFTSPPLTRPWPPQVCFAASVHISHHLKQSVVFVDTTGGLTAGRLLQMLEAETSSREEQVRGNQTVLHNITPPNRGGHVPPLEGRRTLTLFDLTVRVLDALETSLIFSDGSSAEDPRLPPV